MKKVYVILDENDVFQTICNSQKEVEWTKRCYRYRKHWHVRIYVLDDTPFDMLENGIKKTWCYYGSEEF